MTVFVLRGYVLLLTAHMSHKFAEAERHQCKMLGALIRQADVHTPAHVERMRVQTVCHYTSDVIGVICRIRGAVIQLAMP